MHLISCSPSEGSVAPLVEQYLPLTDAEPIERQFHHRDEPLWAHDTLHRALRPLLHTPGSTLDLRLAEMRQRINALEAALPGWIEALRCFATEAAPRLQARIEALPSDEWIRATSEAIDTEFFACRAPCRPAPFAEMDVFIREDLHALEAAVEYFDMNDAVRCMTSQLEGMTSEIRAYRLALAKCAFDAALGSCPSAELGQEQESLFAREVETIFSFPGFAEGWKVDEPGDWKDLKDAWLGNVGGPPESPVSSLRNALRLSPSTWHFLGAFLNCNAGGHSRYGTWLWELSQHIETLAREGTAHWHP